MTTKDEFKPAPERKEDPTRTYLSMKVTTLKPESIIEPRVGQEESVVVAFEGA